MITVKKNIPSFTCALDAIGNTALVKIDFETTAYVYAKLEYLNPSGSVKDRSAHFMIAYAETHGLLKPGGTIIDASSGNHGISLAMIGAIKGYPVIICASEKISKEKLDAIRAYGAQVIMCPATLFIEDEKSYHSVAKHLAAETPNSFMPNQYFNTVNALAHYTLLGPEIWEQTEGKITHFFAAAGTGGTISGVGKFLKEKNKSIKIIGFDAATSYHATKGNPRPYKIEGMGIDFNSPVMDYTVIDDIIPVEDNNALHMLQLLAKKYGFMAGLSSAAVAYGVQQYVKNLDHKALAVMIFGDSGRAYLSKNVY